MTMAETIYQHSLKLPEDVDREALDFINFLEQCYFPASITTKQHSDTEDILDTLASGFGDTEQQAALDYLSSVHIDWNSKPIADRNVLYDDSRN